MTIAELIQKNVATYRSRREWTQADLAENLEALGLPWDRSTVAKVESGRRQVTVEELVVLAAALDVSPLALFLPRDDTQRVQITPNKSVDGYWAWQWARGELVPVGGQLPADFRFYREGSPSTEANADKELVGLLDLRSSIAQIIDAAGGPSESGAKAGALAGDLQALREDVDALHRRAKRKLPKGA